MHQKFNKTLELCFENNRPSEYQTGLKMLISEQSISREDTGYISDLYCDTRPIYLPPTAKHIFKKIISN